MLQEKRSSNLRNEFKKKNYESPDGSLGFKKQNEIVITNCAI